MTTTDRTIGAPRPGRGPLDDLPRIAGADDPIGGIIKVRPEDFIVDEQPQYDPCGQGEHIYLYVEKSGLSTSQLIRILAQHFRVDDRAIGYAGMKDKHALTRQVISIHAPGKRIEDFPSITHEKISILWADHHTNKLRVGHLKGNRFSIRIREVDPLRVLSAKRTVDRLIATGLPNYFGPQRFGARGNNHTLGRLLLVRDWQGFLDGLLGPGDAANANLPADGSDAAAQARALYAEGRFAEAAGVIPRMLRHERAALRALASGATPDEAIRAIHPMQMRFWISAFQSGVFNRFLGARVTDGTFDRLLLGDVACKLRNGALFDADDRTLADPDTAHRLASFEVAPSGPLWGPKMKRATGAPGDLETRLLRDTGVTLESFAAAADTIDVDLPGARRPLRVALTDVELEGGIDEHGPFIRIAFDLPPGSFATVVIREITGIDAPMPADAIEDGDHD
jgi:tRNA pseudouridine13 synthase